MNNADELGVEKFEVSVHIGSRPEHEEWQGKIFTKKGLYSICGLGSATGICGINCRHSFYPYFEGTKEHYSQDDLDSLANEKVEFNGESLTRYEGEQHLRGIERNIRRYKRQALTQEAAGVDNTRARQKIGEWQAAARDFTKQTGITRDSAREYVGTSGKQLRGISVSVAGFSDNLKKAQDIKRLDNARNKVIADTQQGKPMNFRQTDGGSPNPNYKKGGGYAKNCQTCVVAYELRRRGYDVEALPNYKGSMLDVLSYRTNIAWVNR
ncbi:phage minor capsid protein [Treponema pectinovorum]|uniref:phage minor capsid protein n=1 Tax=Treponema pectinovorum TaxID=164 RepID=UPI0036F22505